tara:strand:+ start:1651 stop:4602 length:2952 start_codon:yes stop_codon:yes gene_type:complete
MAEQKYGEYLEKPIKGKDTSAVLPLASTLVFEGAANLAGREQIMLDPDNDSSDAIDDFVFGFRMEDSLTENIGEMLKATFPVLSTEFRYDSDGEGFNIKTPEEVYGDSYMDSSFKERLAIHKQVKEADLAKKYPEQYAQWRNGDQSGSTTFGNFIGAVGLDVLLPFKAATIPKTAIMAAGLGGLYSVTDDIVEGQNVSAGKAALMSVAGGGIAFGLGKAGAALTKRKEGKIAAYEVTKADEALDRISYVAAETKIAGKTAADVPSEVLERLGYTADDVAYFRSLSNHKTKFPQTMEEATFIVSEAKDLAKEGFKRQGIVSQFLQPVLEVVQNSAPQVANSLNKMEYFRHSRLFKYLGTEKDRKILAKAQGVDPQDAKIGVGDTIKVLKQLSDKDDDLLTMAGRNGDDNAIVDILSKYTSRNAAKTHMENTRRVIDDIGNGLEKASNGSLTRTKNYWPSSVKDLKGLRKTLGNDKRIGTTQLNKYIEDYAKHLQVAVDAIPDAELSNFLTKIAQGEVPEFTKKGFSYAKGRKVRTINSDMAKHYERNDKQLYNFVGRSVDFMETARFLGTSNFIKKTTANTKLSTDDIFDNIDLDLSVASMLAQKAPNLPAGASDDITNILKARFGTGQQSPHAAIKFMRDLGYAWTLANPFSALVQLSDVGLSMWMNGFTNTLRASLSPRVWDMLQFGLADTVQAMAVNRKDLSPLLTNFMKVSGFSKFDRIGKNIFMNAAWLKAQKQAQSKLGQDALRRKYKDVYGKEFDDLIDNLKAGNINNENVKLLMWHELSGAQPISLSKTPLKSLENPNGRVMYALKMFAINQINLIGRQTFKKLQSKDPRVRAEGIKATAMLLPTIGFVGASVQSIREYIKNGFNGLDPSEMDERTGEYMLKLIGANYRTIDNLKEGQVATAFGDIVGLTPPAFQALTDVVVGGLQGLDGEIGTNNELVKNLPVVGGLINVLFNDVDADWAKQQLSPSPKPKVGFF